MSAKNGFEIGSVRELLAGSKRGHFARENSVRARTSGRDVRFYFRGQDARAPVALPVDFLCEVKSGFWVNK